MIGQPPSGFYLRARFADHHTAGFVFHRDDREGHVDPDQPQASRVWWFHDQQRWMCWRELTEFVVQRPGGLVLEPLFAAAPEPGCQPDGAHGVAHCAPAFDFRRR